MRRAEVVDAVLEVDITMLGGSARTPTEAAYQLIGTFAEPSTHVVETKRDVGQEVEVVVTTGVLEGDSDFAPHGHVVRLSVETEGSAEQPLKWTPRGAARRYTVLQGSEANYGIERYSLTNVCRKPRRGQKRDESRLVTRQSTTIVG